MIKDISKQNIIHRIGPISISVDEIVGILESKSPKDFSAKNNNIEFSSIDDIKSHKGLFSGRPKIRIDGVNIYFDAAYTQVSHYGGNENGANLARSLHSEIMSHRSFVDGFSDWSIFKPSIGIPILVSLTVASYLLNKFDVKNTYTEVFDVVNLFFVAAYVLAHIWAGYSFFIRNPVYYNPRVGFWDRNKDTIWVSTITGAIGILLGAAGGKIVEKIGAWF